MKKIRWMIVFFVLIAGGVVACDAEPTESDTNDEQVAATAVPEQPESANEETSEDAEEESVVEVAELPKLPGLNGGGGGSIGGGGGFAENASIEEAESLAVQTETLDADTSIMLDEDYVIYDPFADAEFVLNATLPTDPTALAVYQQFVQDGLTIEEIQRIAGLLGVNGEVYTEIFPNYEEIEPGARGEEFDWVPPTNHFVFDGSRMISVWGSSLSYYDQSLESEFVYESMMPFEEAAPIAEAFLNERGLLDFEYELRPPLWDNRVVEIYRIIDGRSIDSAEINVSVTGDGQILSIYMNPLNSLQLLGDYPLQSAQAAWDNFIANGVDFTRSYYFTYPEEGYPLVEEPFIDEGLYKYWQRNYQDGESVTLYTYPLAYEAVTGDAPHRILAERFVLDADADLLAELAENAGQQVQIVGVVRGDQVGAQTLAVRSWEAIDYVDYQYQSGTIRLADGETLFDTDEGETMLIPNAPSDLTDGEQVYVNGWSIEDSNPYRIFNWQGIDRMVDYSDEELLIEPAIEPEYEEYVVTQVEITAVDLIYIYMPIYEEGRHEPDILIQPAWRFKGSTDTNEGIEIVIQAVAESFVEDGEG